jgi:pyridoxal 5'-phosphate synthase glutaminase subunit Pdx2
VPRVGVLALQGDVREHVAVLRGLGADVVEVRRAEQLDDLDGLVMPGGESTTIAYLLTTSGVRPVLERRLAEGLHVFGTCAGLILLSREILDGRSDQWSYGVLDVSVRRNGYGRQIASFESPVTVVGVGEVPGVFIRAPKIARHARPRRRGAPRPRASGQRVGLFIPPRVDRRHPGARVVHQLAVSFATIRRPLRAGGTMSGHSKWATTKHRKGAKDSARAKVFAKIIRQVEVAAREGGGDPASNASLRTMYQKAREASVPIDTIERAIKRGTGELEGVRYESISYEGYAPGGVAVIVETLTDNRNRTSAEIKHVFSKNGGSIAEPGAVSWQFDRKGIIEVKGPIDEDQLLEWVMEAGGENFSASGENFIVTTEPHDVGIVRDALEGFGVKIVSADLTLVAQNVIPIEDETEAKKILRLMDAIDDHDDVQNVYANFDVSDEILASFEG